VFCAIGKGQKTVPARQLAHYFHHSLSNRTKPMKTILLLAAIHLLIAHQSRKKIHPGKASPAKQSAQVQQQKSSSGFIFSNMKTDKVKEQLLFTSALPDTRKGRKSISCGY
jgi:hypothetical protein